jgi:hypothetical protein
MNDRPGEPELRRWAQQELGLDATATVEDARRAFLRRVSDNDFLPQPATAEALGILQPPAGRPAHCLEAEAAAERRLREEIELFAADFFQFDVPERKNRWSDLMARARPWPSLKGFLNMLRQGLNMDLRTVGPEDALLARKVAELFTLPPPERARRRQEFLRAAEEEADGWEQAALAFQAREPGLAALEPVLLARLADRPHAARRAAAARKKRARALAAATPASNGQGSGLKYSWVIILVFIGLARACTSAFQDSGSSRNIRPQLPVQKDFFNDGKGRELQEKWRFRLQDKGIQVVPGKPLLELEKDKPNGKK